MMVLPKRPWVFVDTRDEVGRQREAIDRFLSPFRLFLAWQVQVDLVAGAGFGGCNAEQCQSLYPMMTRSAAQGLDLWNYNMRDGTPI